MLQFSKRLLSKSIRITLVNTRFISKTISSTSSTSTINLDTISDGYDDGGHAAAESTQAYLESFQKEGSKTLSELIQKLSKTEYPAHCIIYDPFLPWCLDVAKELGLFAAPFFTQSCAVDAIYYHVYKGSLKLPVTDQPQSLIIPGLPAPLEADDMPSFISDYGSYPAAFDMIISQFSNIHKADCILCNTVYDLENETADWLSTIWPLRTVGPTIPSMYLDKQLQDDRDYGFSIFKPNNEACINWLNNNKPKGSVIYVSFGSLASLGAEQMEEIAHGLKNSNHYFLWVVRASEVAKLPPNFAADVDIDGKGLIVSWCPQLEVLEHEAVGCFVTHCGWNSTLEGLSLGVPMVAMPQWTDQATNAKYIEDVWKMGVRCQKNEEGIVKREMVEKCLRGVMEGEEGKEMKRNADKWRKMMKEAAGEGGSSDRNISDFVDSLRNHRI
uniref:Glycosyltransferase n=1 Tax=Linum usitatissimum TaxID=4006 RepID=I2BH56_LINUS|nr:UDP-glycosyltransferase 1 [Linum usitatissimum]